MRRLIVLIVCAGGLSAAGCGGGGENKMADKPTDQMIAADKAEQKKVEDEERGTPIKKRK